MRRTKIIATLGPATSKPGVLDALVAGGLDVARLNTAHATLPELSEQLAAVRAAAARSGRTVAVMLDLRGVKLRLGEVAEGVRLRAGDAFDLSANGAPGDATRASVCCANLARDLHAGDRVLVDDGRIELSVTGVSGEVVHTRVETGGPLLSNKGVNVPGVTLGIESVTERDLENARWALESGVDMLAQSFVRSAADIATLRASMGDHPLPIVAKIEKHEAVANLDAIVEAADVVMVARGDLGVELSPEEVPVVQRRIVAACRAAGKPVIVATQMLESMTTAMRPTRAEASDVANAIFDEVDAVMLSGETAIGRHPAHVLATMERIVVAAESVALDRTRPARPIATDDISGAVSRAVYDLAEDLDLAAIVTATQSGATARAVAAHRPSVPVVAATPDATIARRLAVVWGVLPVVIPTYATIDEMIQASGVAVQAAGLASPGDLIAVTGGVAVHVAGSTNLVQVHRL